MLSINWSAWSAALHRICHNLCQSNLVAFLEEVGVSEAMFVHSRFKMYISYDSLILMTWGHEKRDREARWLVDILTVHITYRLSKFANTFKTHSIVLILITSLRSASRDSRRLVASPCWEWFFRRLILRSSTSFWSIDFNCSSWLNTTLIKLV